MSEPDEPPEDPVTLEEIDAYEAGQLSADEEARMETRLEALASVDDLFRRTDQVLDKDMPDEVWARLQAALLAEGTDAARDGEAAEPAPDHDPRPRPGTCDEA